MVSKLLTIDRLFLFYSQLTFFYLQLTCLF